MRVRPRRAAGLVLLLAAIVIAFVYRSWVSAQARALVVLTVVSDPPVVGWLSRVVTNDPRREELQIEGVPTTVVRTGIGKKPALVFVNGVTARGRHHPDVRSLASGLARAGFVVLVPDPRGLARGELTEQTLEDTVAVARVAAERPDANGTVALVGVSAGAALALLVAQEDALAPRVSVVAGIAPYASLREAARIATTGTYGERRASWRAKPFLGLVVARSLVAGLPPGRDRERLRSALLALPDDTADPLRLFRRLPAGLEADARALGALLGNRDPAAFDELYAALPARYRRGLDTLSPLHGANRIRAPVELASAPRDDYFPLADSRALVVRTPSGRLTVTGALDHAVPELSVNAIADLARVDGWIVRTLRAARQRSIEMSD
jgi:pimeloyl-ACP methyl ester carboxylesterase